MLCSSFLSISRPSSCSFLLLFTPCFYHFTLLLGYRYHYHYRLKFKDAEYGIRIMATPSILPLSHPLGPDVGLKDPWAAPGLYSSPVHTNTNSIDSPRPIMSRISTTDIFLSFKEDVAMHEAYIRPKPDEHIPGTLPYDRATEGLTYTISHLPDIDETSIRVWKALHGLRPRCSDFTSEVARGIAKIATASKSISASTSEAKGRQTCPSAAASSFSLTSSTASACPCSQPHKQDVHINLLRGLFNWSSLQVPPPEDNQTETGREERNDQGPGQTKAYYGVLFLSQRSPSSSTSMSLPLYKADRLAHEEAVRSGGLLMYFYGAPDPLTGTNLATCIWTDRESARKASTLPRHREAVRLARGSYEWFELRRYKVVLCTKDEGGERLRVEAWEEEHEG